MSPTSLRETVERFLSACRRPAVLEPGETPIPLLSGQYQITDHGGRLHLEAWDERRNLHRRIREAETAHAGRLRLKVERFGRGTGTIELVDLDRPSARTAVVQSIRQRGADVMERLLARQYPDWRRRESTSGADLEHTLSPAYARAFATQGRQGLAALLAPRGGDPLHALTFGLLWLDYLREREPMCTVSALVLFLPEADVAAIVRVLPGLDPARVRVSLFAYDGNGVETQVDARDTGNVISTILPAPPEQLGPLPDEVRTLSSHGDVETAAGLNGEWSFRVRGLEFARWRDGRLFLTLERAYGPALDWVARLTAVRNPDSPDRHHPWFLRKPEAWLESQVRANLRRVDRALLPQPLYGQVEARAGADGGIADLAAVDRRGRLVLMELKASQDPHLPVQALDYWVRLRQHASGGGLSRCGYFPRQTLSDEAPRLLLVAPALEFHPTTERLLAFYHPQVEVERVGLGVEWRKSLRVVLRVRGAERPEWDAEGSLGEHGCEFPGQRQKGSGFVEPG